MLEYIPKNHQTQLREVNLRIIIKDYYDKHYHINPPTNFQPKELCLGTAPELKSPSTLSAVLPRSRPGPDSTASGNKCEQNLIFCWINLNCKSIVEFFIVLQGASAPTRMQVMYKSWCQAWHR